MADRTMYTRAYFKSSVGQSVFAEASKAHPLFYTALLGEFRNHAKKWNREPKALVTGRDRIATLLTSIMRIASRQQTFGSLS